MVTRRTILQAGGMVAFAAGVTAPLFVTRVARAATAAGSKKILVVAYQRFGMDGLLAVQPYTNDSLRMLRPNLMLPSPGSGKEGALTELNEGYGLNPSLAALAPLYREGSLAFIQAAGSPDTTRSHLDAAQWWESGTPGNRATADGWMNRALRTAGADETRVLRAVSMTPEQPRALYGSQPSVSIADLNQLELGMSHANDSATLRQIEEMYARSDLGSLQKSAAHSFELARVLEANKDRQTPAYPHSPFGDGLRDIATLIKADVGLQVAFAESRTSASGKGSWDTHSLAMDTTYRFAFPAIAEDFAQSLVAFWQDLGPRQEDVVLVTHTDFGRNVVENTNRGSDHGRATTMMVLGGGIQGGRIHGELPERFAKDMLEDQLDLPVTTDYRSVLAGLAGQQLGIPKELDGQVFPGWSGQRFNLVRA